MLLKWYTFGIPSMRIVKVSLKIMWQTIAWTYAHWFLYESFHSWCFYLFSLPLFYAKNWVEYEQEFKLFKWVEFIHAHTHTFLFLFLWSYWYGILYPNGTSVNCLFNTLQSKFIIVFLHLGWCTGTRFISSRLLVIVCCHVFLLSFILSRFYFSPLKCKKNFHPKDSLSLSFKFERTKLFFFFLYYICKRFK